jgi:hypothetical protein
MWQQKRTAREELFFFYCYQILEEEVVNFMDEMLTEEGDTTMHNDEDQEVFERAVHDNACFDFMF